MNSKLLLVALIPIFAVLTIYLYDGVGTQDHTSKESLNLGAGHFTVTVKDAMGVTTAVRQTDNAILNTGENCVAKMMFGDSVDAGTGVCTGTTDEGWDFFCLDESALVSVDQVDLITPATSAGLSTCLQAATTWNQNSTLGTDTTSKVTLRLSKTFTNSGALENIQSVGLFNSSTVATNNMLSKGNFTLVAVPNLGTLTVNYDYEVGGGTVP